MKLAIDTVTFITGTIETIKGNGVVQESNDIEYIKGFKEYRKNSSYVIYPYSTMIIEGSFNNSRLFNGIPRKYPLVYEGDVLCVHEVPGASPGYMMIRDTIEVLADEVFVNFGRLALGGFPPSIIFDLDPAHPSGYSHIAWHLFQSDANDSWFQTRFRIESFDEGTGIKSVDLYLQNGNGNKTSNGKIALPFLARKLEIVWGIIAGGTFGYTLGVTEENRAITKTILT